jgi:hypothetical protein
MRQNQRGEKRLPYKRKGGERAVRRTRGVTWGGNPTQAESFDAAFRRRPAPRVPGFARRARPGPAPGGPFSRARRRPPREIWPRPRVVRPARARRPVFPAPRRLARHAARVRPTRALARRPAAARPAVPPGGSTPRPCAQLAPPPGARPAPRRPLRAAPRAPALCPRRPTGPPLRLCPRAIRPDPQGGIESLRTVSKRPPRLLV